MKQSQKINLILIQAFPANETLSAGIIQYLNNYFNVYFVNLPGFHPNAPAINNVRLEYFVEHVEAKIKQLGLEKYILAGISLGFLVANSITIDKKHCVAILASGPYLGYEYLNFSKLKRLSRMIMLNFILHSGCETKLWNAKFFKSILSNFLGKKSKEIIKVIIDEVDPKSFFSVGLELLKYDKLPQFQNIPYILLINPKDSVINFEKTLYAFWQGVETDQLRVIFTKASHYPEDPSYEYFQSTFTNNEIESLFNFVQYISNNQLSFGQKQTTIMT